LQQIRLTKSVIVILVCISSVTLFAAAPKTVKADQTGDTSVCSISQSPDRYNGKLIRVVARVESDGREWTVLTDKACKYSGMALDRTGRFRGQKELENALYSKPPGTRYLMITGIFIGKFEWRPNQVPSRILHLKKVLDLKVSQIPVSDSGSLLDQSGHVADLPKPQ
jgi:hypothetical protein